MKESNQMKKKKKLRLKRVIIVFASIYVGYILISTQVTMLKLKKEMEVKQQELTKQTEKNQKLQDEVMKMTNSTDEYYERLARERLGLIKPGETPVIENK
jgi:cell division protein FtsB